MNFVGVNAMFCIMSNTCPTMSNTCPTMWQKYTAQEAATTSADGKWQSLYGKCSMK
jgi:hypothetical protein